MNKIEELNDIQKELHWRILDMIAGNLDRWQPDADPESVSAAVESASLVAAGIAQKLAKAVQSRTARLRADAWREVVEEATRSAFIEIDATEPLVKIGQNPGFVRAVEECTALVVAPPGSDWGRRLTKRTEQRVQNELRRYGFPKAEIEKILAERRSKQKGG